MLPLSVSVFKTHQLEYSLTAHGFILECLHFYTESSDVMLTQWKIYLCIMELSNGKKRRHSRIWASY